MNELEQQGLIQAFVYTYELAWNVMKDYYKIQAEESIQGSRDAIRLAFRPGLISDGEGWMKMIESRIDSVHTYNEETANTANKIAENIFHKYYYLFEIFRHKMLELQ